MTIFEEQKFENGARNEIGNNNEALCQLDSIRRFNALQTAIMEKHNILTSDVSNGSGNNRIIKRSLSSQHICVERVAAPIKRRRITECHSDDNLHRNMLSLSLQRSKGRKQPINIRRKAATAQPTTYEFSLYEQLLQESYGDHASFKQKENEIFECVFQQWKSDISSAQRNANANNMTEQ